MKLHKTMLDKKSSDRLNILRFPLIMAVIFIHTYSVDTINIENSIDAAKNNSINIFIQNIISQGLARTAVPLFFLMSGYFFFLEFKFSWHGYYEKIISRFRTLLIPFLIWNFLTLTLFAIAQSLPATQEYFSGKNLKIESFSIFDYLNAIFGITKMPIAYQFWFIRDLMILVTLTPIIYFLIEKVFSSLIFILAIFWFFEVWPSSTPSIEATLFFVVGSTIAFTRKNLFALDSKIIYIIPIYLTILIIDAILFNTQSTSSLHKIGIIFGVSSILGLSETILKYSKLKNNLLILANTSFFVFAAHEPLLTLLKKITQKIIHPNSNHSYLILYFLIPIFLSFFLVIFYKKCSILFPHIIRLMTGGR